MACKSCEAADLSGALGTCARCTAIAGISAALLWSLYAAAEGYAVSSLMSWALFGFAVVITVVFIFHVLGHLVLYLNK